MSLICKPKFTYADMLKKVVPKKESENITKRIFHTFAGISHTAGSISDTAGSISDTAGSISDTAGSISDTAGSISATAGSISDTAGSISDTAGSISDTAGSISEPIGSISDTAGSISDTLGSISDSSVGISDESENEKSPICNAINNYTEIDNFNLTKDVCHSYDGYNEYYEKPKSNKLPGGKRYQKDGYRLEKAFYNSLPKTIKKNISVNIKPRYPNGNVIVEFDMIYKSESSKRIISFEIKGVNKHTTNDLERQNKLISQALRQKKYLIENYSDYSIETVYCFVTGVNKDSEEKCQTDEWKKVVSCDIKKSLDRDFIKKIKQNNIAVAIGETPQHCAKKALLMMNLLR